jgi:hypothetical protein
VAPCWGSAIADMTPCPEPTGHSILPFVATDNGCQRLPPFLVLYPMASSAVVIHPEQRLLIWHIAADPGQRRVVTPWGELELGAETGGGREVWVEATAAFDCVLQDERVTLYEHIEPGRHRLLLTGLDRTETHPD